MGILSPVGSVKDDAKKEELQEKLNSLPIKRIRTFHPVGQGAFYTERHNVGKDDEFTIVYDCGTMTKNGGKTLEKSITSAFSKGQNIDILFISHFHEDHINGIKFLAKHCNIEQVVMPLMDKTAITLSKIRNYLNGGTFDEELIDDTEKFFGANTSIIKIKPADIGQEARAINPESDREVERRSIQNSGTIFSISNENAPHDWCFIPFNYKQIERQEQFQKALEESGINLDNIKDVKQIEEHKKEIKKAYEKVSRDLNINSMILFSGRIGGVDDFVECYGSRCHSYYHYRHCFASGCLYTGDVDLNQKMIVENIKQSLDNFSHSIGTVQIPHHGSMHNFDKSILFPNIRCTVFSYGTVNQYGHPSVRVLEDVIAFGAYPHLVTEDLNSIMIQRIVCR